MEQRLPKDVNVKFDKEDYFKEVVFSYPAAGEDGPKEISLDPEKLQDIWDKLWDEGNEDVPEDDLVSFIEYLGTVDYEDLLAYLKG